MKKAFLFFIASASLAFTSCSGDDDSGSSSQGTASMKIDGVLKTFNTVVVNEEIEDGVTIKTFTISNNGSPIEMISFEVEGESVGADQMDYFVYHASPHFANVGSNVSVNSDNTFKATFSGYLYIQDQAYPQITEGVIDVNY